MSIEDVVTLMGLVSLLAGIFLWLGLPAMLIILGIVLMSAGVRMAQMKAPSPTPESLEKKENL